MFPAGRAGNISKAKELNDITAQHIIVLGGTYCQAGSKLLLFWPSCLDRSLNCLNSIMCYY